MTFVGAAQLIAIAVSMALPIIAQHVGPIILLFAAIVLVAGSAVITYRLAKYFFVR
ncbi:hypothetical protein HQO12_11485 [Rhodococcus fascians]|uniref:hypothetical protein n=2 Tax=Nocardiaceae TaxID=85025 RepID=UPI0019597F1C|nr:hypothetical protein [Rhodococcus fascians]MBM7242323.1 hypothetical protein [Rhodococcus fascians]MBY3809548.1 hypothetical protein [Rhodococcus fascians]MBY3840471.1 hypothetical protein [Rhodococcus fascians]MBY3845885.1 hypothetical protein [Rhodococcus fascians]MBY3849901.1 hypothetical protein [Rhodococcus fascians]